MTDETLIPSHGAQDMPAFESFLKTYGAVITDRHGAQQWHTASDETLIGWARSDLAVWTAKPMEQARLVDRLADIGNELRRRQGLSGRSFGADVDARITAIAEIFRAIGWGQLRAESMTGGKS